MWGFAPWASIPWADDGGVPSQTLTPALFTNTQTIYAATVSVGAVTLAPPLLSNAQTFYAAAVAPGSVALTAPLLTNSATFFGPAITVGAVGLTPSLFTNSSTFFGPALSVGAVNLLPPLLVNSNVFYGPTLVGDQALTPSLLQNVSTFFAPVVTGGVVVAPPSHGGGWGRVSLPVPQRRLTYGKFHIQEAADGAAFRVKLSASGVLAVAEKPDRARFTGTTTTVATMKAIESADAGSPIDWAEYDNAFLLAA